ncbi:hypothetical protein ACFXP3_06950 [Streptomyces sp. NPDC059096]|uniref:hypothetical protein n=1 Tax=Streptomyces sp. NPDC059096 TaxID=3346727 RepID=UPI0036759D35
MPDSSQFTAVKPRDPHGAFNDDGHLAKCWVLLALVVLRGMPLRFYELRASANEIRERTPAQTLRAPVQGGLPSREVRYDLTPLEAVLAGVRWNALAVLFAQEEYDRRTPAEA